MNNLKISVITPTFNSSRTIESNINSIINQSYKNFEHIIIDNKSEDGTLEKIRQLYKISDTENNLKIICEKDNGISDAFNKGIENSSGDIVAILNSDDYYLQYNLFERINNIFQSNDIYFVHGDIFFKDDFFGTNIRRPLLCLVQQTMPYNHPSMFFKKKIYDLYGWFDTSFKYAMDYELICKLESKISDFTNRGYYLKGEPLVFVHSGGASWINELKAVQESKTALIKNNLWNRQAEISFKNRIFRIKLKKSLTFFHLNFLVKIWRKFKWQN